MAVQIKTVRTKDMNSGSPSGPRKRDVHYIKINKGNRKGANDHFGGKLVVRSNGVWWIELDTKRNGKPVTIEVKSGDIVFRTDKLNRWQVMSARGFKKRFPEAKI